MGYQSTARNRTKTSKVVNVYDPNQAWIDQEPHWELIECLLTGTYGIRKEGRKYLPQEPREQDDAYQNRLLRSTLQPYYVRLERLLAGMLTRKPVKLNDISDGIREDLFDVDRQGNDLNTWVYETARKAIRYGHVGVLVDAPSDGNGRPYWCSYDPRSIIGWRTEVQDGKPRLIQLRLKEQVTEPDGEYGEKTVNQVRVLTPGYYELFRQDEKKDYTLFEEGKTSLSEIPFSVVYSNRVNYLQSKPPMEDIGELNIKAYQVQSDLDNILHVAAVPMLAIFGFPQSAEEITAGPNEALALPEGASAQYIEPGGASFNALFQRLDQIEKQINELGLASVLGQKLSAETAESKRIDRSQGDSTMMVIAQNMQDMIDNCLRFHADYLNDASPGSALINRDFMGARMDPGEIKGLLELYLAGTITQSTLLTQLEAGEVLGDDFDLEEELEASAAGGLQE